MRRPALTGGCLFLFFCLPVQGQTSFGPSSGHAQMGIEDKDPIAIVELAAPTSWNLSGGAATFAPNLAAEITPIEDWLQFRRRPPAIYRYERRPTHWYPVIFR